MLSQLNFDGDHLGAKCNACCSNLDLHNSGMTRDKHGTRATNLHGGGHNSNLCHISQQGTDQTNNVIRPKYSRITSQHCNRRLIDLHLLIITHLLADVLVEVAQPPEGVAIQEAHVTLYPLC